jgi:hypothetical protein
MQRLIINAPPIHVVDLLSLDILRFLRKIQASTSNFVDRKRELLAQRVRYNNHIGLMDMYLNGELLEFINQDTKHIHQMVLFKTRVYPLTHNSKHYLILVK